MEHALTPSNADSNQGGAAILPLGKRQELILVLIAASAVAVAHAVATWGHVPLYWGDYGFILDLISRAQGGEVPYRDFHWNYPPLSIWIMGALTRAFGAELTGVWRATLLIYVSIILAFVWYVRLVAPAGTQALVAGVGVFLAVALANLGGAPLPLGTYSPPGPVGFLMLLVGWCAALRYITTDRLRWGLLGSVAAGLAVLAKHDFWIAAALLVWVCAWHAFRSQTRWRLAGALLLALPSVIVTLAGWGAIAAVTNVGTVVDMLRGFGVAAQQARRGAPTLEILTIQVMVVAALAVLPLLCVELVKPRDARRWTRTLICLGIAVAAAVLWVSQALRIATDLAASGMPDTPTALQGAFADATSSARHLVAVTVRTLINRSARHALPILLPTAAALALVFGWPRRLSDDKRRWLLLLIGFAITLRLRRQFEFTEWFVVLVELPVYAAILTVMTLSQSGRRLLPVRAAFVGLGLIGMVAYYQYGRGAFTRRGVHPLSWTPRGSIRSGFDTTGIRRVVDVLNQVDPSGQRPLVSFGYTNGFNYFTARPYPRNTPIAFPATSAPNADPIVRGILQSQPPAILIDGPFWDAMLFPKKGVYWLSWDRPFEHPDWVKKMRADFMPILAKCRQVARLGTGPRAFTVHDCGQPSLAAEP